MPDHPPSIRPARPQRVSQDRRRALVLDTRELGRRPGAMLRCALTAPAAAGLRLELIGVPEGAEIAVDLRLEAVMEGVLASGAAVVPVEGECGRCLEPVTDEIEVEFQELFAYDDSTTSETTEEDETLRLAGDLLDLEPLLRDTIVLALPMTPLCREDCPGLCATCGERLAPGEPPHDHPVTDPRWAALQRLADQAEDPARDGAGTAGA